MTAGRVDMRAPAVTGRLRTVALRADLRTPERLVAKIDMSASAIARRLRQASDLRALCLRLVGIGAANGLGAVRRS
jgi:hypothetical protein